MSLPPSFLLSLPPSLRSLSSPPHHHRFYLPTLKSNALPTKFCFFLPGRKQTMAPAFSGSRRLPGDAGADSSSLRGGRRKSDVEKGKRKNGINPDSDLHSTINTDGQLQLRGILRLKTSQFGGQQLRLYANMTESLLIEQLVFLGA